MATMVRYATDVAVKIEGTAFKLEVVRVNRGAVSQRRFVVTDMAGEIVSVSFLFAEDARECARKMEAFQGR